ncbi:hypothetical protein [Klebsiella michiganensis]|uniref:hypothetical protein n=1 Tax=Klebsiella michiganensis TaxID=1134687 RepID=UPI0025A29A3E|nr:hypothetical protein [Klebsiella michiganensis]MDM6716793.1 hypothetical protein [Klebsiella michiganensis]MDM6915195.1 hypothetical protein [Klebsiella michiganensis]MDM6919708.1 hypothetical protein [Klebsiella michiganensis]MDM6925756.1 hypothetical protein [Klebsiella michiganensis]MDM6931837.1 hypothetical protein [Klebsiella michiganensis]
MSVTSEQILDTARLCLSENVESGFRSAISRAYYSMLHESMSSLQAMPHFSYDHHKNTVGYMVTPSECKGEPYPTQTLKSLGWVLKQWRDARNEADYDLSNVTVSSEMGQDAIEAAELYFERWAQIKSAKAS